MLLAIAATAAIFAAASHEQVFVDLFMRACIAGAPTYEAQLVAVTSKLAAIELTADEAKAFWGEEDGMRARAWQGTEQELPFALSFGQTTVDGENAYACGIMTPLARADRVTPALSGALKLQPYRQEVYEDENMVGWHVQQGEIQLLVVLKSPVSQDLGARLLVATWESGRADPAP